MTKEDLNDIKQKSQSIRLPICDPKILNASAIVIQKHVRGHISRNKTKKKLGNIPHVILMRLKGAENILRN